MLMLVTTSCFRDSDEETYSPYAILKSFSIGDLKSQYPTFTAEGVDTFVTRTITGSSLPFSIDQAAGEVYNADSLPFATKVDKVAKVVCIEIDIDDFISVNGANISFVEPSTQQSTYYDLSLIMAEGKTFADLSECWNKLGLAELENVKVIDVYDNGEIKSVTVRLIFSSKDRTLEMDEVQTWIDEILKNLKEIGIELRA